VRCIACRKFRASRCVTYAAPYGAFPSGNESPNLKLSCQFRFLPETKRYRSRIFGCSVPKRIRETALTVFYGKMFPYGNELVAMAHAIHDPESLGRYLRAARIEQGMTRDQLAGATGLSPKFISQIEGGKPTAQLGKVMKLLSELGVTLDARSSIPISAEAFAKASRRRRSPSGDSQS